MKQSRNKRRYNKYLTKEPREKFTSDIPLCKAYGCCKVLTPAEYFNNPDYCFTHARLHKKR